MSETTIVRNAIRCRLCGSPADRIGSYFQCQANPGHTADCYTGIFSDLCYPTDAETTKERAENHRANCLALGCGTQIADDAVKHGYTPELLESNGARGDRRLALWNCDGVRAISTNGDTVWEGSDPDGFAALLHELIS